MKRFTGLLALLLLVLLPLMSYGQAVVAQRPLRTTTEESYPIPGSHLLTEQNRKVAEYITQHPEATVRSRLLKTSSWNFVVGTTHTWKSQDFRSEAFFDVPSTCQAVGTHCYIFVEDALWGTRVTQSAVDAVVNAFDNQTPASSSKGVYQMDVDAFGVPPDIDGDSKIIILILDIRDSYSGSGPYVAGYFWGGNETPGYENGNNAEIYYVDADPLNLATPSGVTQAMSTAAHEFQHMIHFNYDYQEETFVNEGCACYAQSYCGYGIRDQHGYVNETNHSLLGWRAVSDPDVVNDYSRAGRFFQYIGDQFGSGSFRSIVASKLHGLAGLDAGLTSYGADRQFAQIFPDWLIANILDDRTVDQHYGYLYQDLLKAVGTNYTSPNVGLSSGTVEALAAEYLSYTHGSDLRFTITTPSPYLLVKAVEIGSPSRVLDVTPGVEFHEPGLGSTYSAVHFVIINTGPTSQASYSFESSGNGGAAAFELRYDNSEPSAYLPLQAGDSVCVWFNGMYGTRLDSIRVAVNRTGSISGGVFAFTGVQNPSPLGTKLVSITASRTNPSSNWVTVDLRSRGVDAGNDFAVAFACAGAPSTSPRVMVVKEPYGSGDFHSFGYYTEASPDWYVLTSTPDTAFAFSIRAYVSYGATDVGNPADLLPAVTRLEQNYPNPFNPVTNIHYTVGGTRLEGRGTTEEGAGGSGLGAGNVRLVVYDLLGREVATLVNETKGPGSYQVSFDGSGLASGIYYCRLTAGRFIQTKAMMLVR